MANKKVTRELQYKPWLMTTTMRNPERLGNFLRVLKNFDGKELTNNLCIEIEGQLIKEGLYRPMKVSETIKQKWKEDVELSDLEVIEVLENNPQDHKEAGFDKGWPSRFDTHYALAKRFGFAYYEIGQPILFSKLGNLYIDDSHPENEQLCFLNAFVNYHRKNPFQRVRNRNRPLVLLLQVLKKLEEESGIESPGIGRHELPLLLVWRDNDADALFDQIMKLRKIHGFQPSSEVIFELCEEINGGWHNAIKMKTIVSEEPDEILRKLRLTGLFSLRGEGRFLSINQDSRHTVELILSKHSDIYDFESEREYFDFASNVDEELISESAESIPKNAVADVHMLDEWIKHFGEECIREELRILGGSRKHSTDPILKLINQPLRLEFLTSLLLRILFDHCEVVPNYRRDDTGLPISHAPGNNPDIEMYFPKESVDSQLLDLYEVTLINGTAQLSREMIPITRHLQDKISLGFDAKVIFMAPSISKDAYRYVDYLKTVDSLTIIPQSITDFANS
jgi:hypothetical protein